MKIVVVGARGLIGAKTVAILNQHGHSVLGTSTKTGVNSVTGEGLLAAFDGADAVVDLTNAPSWEDDAVMRFFETSTCNMLDACVEKHVKHFVALSVVGTAGLQQSGYFRAKQKQETLIKEGKVPFTIVQATQFFEFIGQIADFGTKDGVVHLSSAQFQPIAGDDVAAVMAEVATSKPINGTIEIAGPERASFTEVVSQFLKANNDKRIISASNDTPYYGIKLETLSLVPQHDGARLGTTTLRTWLGAQQLVLEK